MTAGGSPAPERAAIVTGAGSPRGIGQATARCLAADGWAVAVLDVDAAAAERTAESLRAEGRTALAVGADVSDEESVATALARIEADLPPVGALVNNAGITSPSSFAGITVAEWERIFAVNVLGSFLMTRGVVAGMVDRGHGRIISLSSVSAQRGGGVFGGVHYSAAKAALLGFTRALARELGPHGVTVNAVAPGLIDTDITAGQLSEQQERAVIATVPAGRKGRVEEVGAVIAFLASDAAAYITGATYDINGGSHIH